MTFLCGGNIMTHVNSYMYSCPLRMTCKKTQKDKNINYYSHDLSDTKFVITFT